MICYDKRNLILNEVNLKHYSTSPLSYFTVGNIQIEFSNGERTTRVVTTVICKPHHKLSNFCVRNAPGTNS